MSRRFLRQAPTDRTKRKHYYNILSAENASGNQKKTEQEKAAVPPSGRTAAGRKTMIIVLKPHTSEENIRRVESLVKSRGLDTHISRGAEMTIIGCIGDTTRIDPRLFEVDQSVDRVMQIQEPYKLANRAFHPEDSVVDVSGVKIGGGHMGLIAGPCSVESFDQVLAVARAAKASGANLLRGGAFKPRTSPYSFQGLGVDGLRILCEVRDAVGLPIVTELMSPQHLDLFSEKVDLIQIGARNMQNFDLLKQLGQVDRPILLKRGLNATYEEWIMSAEYIMAAGNKNVILCERGIRTFETYTRNTLDLQSIPVLHRKTHLPVIVDPSHAGGKWWLVEPMAKAAVAAGADGLMIEVHNDPERALCDGAQSLKPEKYDTLLRQVRQIAEVVGKTL